MAGHPIYTALDKRLTESGDELFNLVADGRPMREIAEHFESSRTQIYRWIAAAPDRKAALASARKCAASAHVEDALDGLDTASPADAHIARERAGMRRWIAERWDRETWGKDEASGATVNFNALHLTFLQNRMPPGGPTEPSALPQVAASAPPALLRTEATSDGRL